MSADAVMALVLETLRDTAMMLPVLLVLYAGLEWLSHREGVKLLARSRTVGAFGPLAGAALGLLPQCGMSVFMTSLFLSGHVTTGTLVATYIATSDEALPVLIANGSGWRVVASLVAIKLGAGAVAGLIVDVAGRRPYYRHVVAHDPTPHVRVIRSELVRAEVGEVLRHSLRRTLEIGAWVFVVSVALGLVLRSAAGGGMLAAVRRHRALEVIAASVFGLIPNCGASVALAEGYLHSTVSFGATVAGLSAGAGYGPIVLFKEGRTETAARLLVLCLAFSIVAGLVAGAFR